MSSQQSQQQQSQQQTQQSTPPQTQATVVVSSAQGYTGMTIMQEIALTKAFKKSIALIKTSLGHGEANDIQKMDSSFVVERLDYECEKLCKVLQGADVLILVPPAEAEKVKISHQLIECAKKANLKNIVLLSSMGADLSAAPFKEFMAIEEAVKSSGINYCIVRAGLYCQGILLYTDQIKQGTLPINIGQTPANFVDLADVGVALVRVAAQMTQGDMHAKKTYSITGPASLTGNQIAEELTSIGKTKVQFKNELIKLEECPLIDQAEAEYLKACYNSIDSINQVSNDFQMLTGNQSTPFKTFVEKYANELNGSVTLEE